MPIVILLMLVLFAYVVLNERKVNCVQRRVVCACFLSIGFIIVGVAGTILLTEGDVGRAYRLPRDSYYEVLSFCYNPEDKKFPVFIRRPDGDLMAIEFDYIDPRITNGSNAKVVKVKDGNRNLYRLVYLN